MYAFCAPLRTAYYAALTCAHIQSSFHRCGLWPLDRSRLLSTLRTRDEDAFGDVLSPDELRELLKSNHKDPQNELLEAQITLLRTCFVDIKRGAVLTSESEIAPARQNARAIDARRMEQRSAAKRRTIRYSELDQLRLKRKEVEESFVLGHQAALAFMLIERFVSNQRTMKLRR